MNQLFLFPSAIKRNPAVEVWVGEHADELGEIARRAELADPKGLLEGNGKYMRHVKLRPGQQVDEAALRKLIHVAYVDMKQRLNAE